MTWEIHMALLPWKTTFLTNQFTKVQWGVSWEHLKSPLQFPWHHSWFPCKSTRKMDVNWLEVQSYFFSPSFQCSTFQKRWTASSCLLPWFVFLLVWGQRKYGLGHESHWRHHPPEEGDEYKATHHMWEKQNLWNSRYFKISFSDKLLQKNVHKTNDQYILTC